MNAVDIKSQDLMYVRWLFYFSLILHFLVSLLGWNHSLLDAHGFRQSQTALTSYYFAKDGFKLAYDTPVLGAPWSLPMEFPLYQGLVAFISKVSGCPLEPVGRGVSLFFFYASVFVLYRLVVCLTENRIFGYLSVVFTLLSPLYLFWSRTFMIESTALFFSLFYLFGTASALKARCFKWLLLGCGAGVLAGLVKITTFSITFAAAGMLVLLWFYQQGSERFTRKNILFFIKLILFFAVIPLVVSLAWVSFSDSVKWQNPLAQCLTAQALAGHNFGDFWKKVTGNFHHVPMGLVFAGFLTAFFYMIYAVKKQRALISVLVFSFLLGPLVYTNLYIVHTYYWYANTVYLSVILAVLAGSLLMSQKFSFLARYVFIPSTAVVMLSGYVFFYLPKVLNNAGKDFIASAMEVTRQTDEECVLLIHGLGWDSSFPYYARRRAIMLSGDMNGSAFEEVVRRTGEENVRALVVSAATEGKDRFVADALKRFRLSKGLNVQDRGLIVYVK